MKINKELLNSIQNCLIPKLSKNFDESSNHKEFADRNNNLPQNFTTLEQYLGDLDLTSTKEASSVIALLIILFKELSCDAEWNGEISKEYSQKLNIYFELLCSLRLGTFLRDNSNFCKQEVFDKSLDYLHAKLTSEDLKKYPGQIEVYFSITKDIKRYNVLVKPQKVLPASLLLIEDYIKANQVKGLISCLAILETMDISDFEGGNYYEVIYRSLKKVFLFTKDNNVTKLTHACLLELCKVFPKDIKTIKLDDIYSEILSQLYTESNLYRKAECFKFCKKIIEMHQVNCVNRNTFKLVISDSLDLCTNDAVAKVLLDHILQNLKEWIKYCWCIWKLSSDYKIISSLFKVLYTCKDENLALEIQNLCTILINLCKVEEKKQILVTLNNPNVNDLKFNERMEIIKQEINC